MMKFARISLVAVIAFVVTGVAAFADDTFEYKGYMRIGTQLNTNLRAPDSYGISGAQKWDGRLGCEDQARPNEDPFFLEQTFIKNWTNENGSWAKAVVLMNYYGRVVGDNVDKVGTDSANTDATLRIRQAYIEMGGFSVCPNTAFWIGKKYLNRDDIHILDWYFLDFSGNGLGASNIANLGIDLAYIQRVGPGNGTSDGVSSANGRFVSHNAVIKYENNTVRFDSNINYVRKTESAGVSKNTLSYMLSGMFKPEKFFYALPGSSKVFAQYATGNQANCMWFGNRFTNNVEETQWFSKDVTKDTFAADVVATGVLTVLDDKLNINPAVGYRYYHLARPDSAPAVADGNSYRWNCQHIFLTERSQYNFTPNVAAALEVGYSLAKSDNDNWGFGPANWAGFQVTEKNKWTKELKISPAIVLTMDSSYWSRPQLRIFWVTKVADKGAQDASTTSYARKNVANWFGAQAEAWW